MTGFDGGQSPYGTLFAVAPGGGRMRLRCDALGHLITAPYGGNADSNYFLPAIVDNSYNATSIYGLPCAVTMVRGFVVAQAPVWLMFYNEVQVPVPPSDTPWVGLYLQAQQPFEAQLNLDFSTGLGFAVLADPPSPPNKVNNGSPAILGLNISYGTG